MRSKLYKRREQAWTDYVVKFDQPKLTIKFWYNGGQVLNIRAIYIQGASGRVLLDRQYWSFFDSYIKHAVDRVCDSLEESVQQRLKFSKHLREKPWLKARLEEIQELRRWKLACLF